MRIHPIFGGTIAGTITGCLIYGVIAATQGFSEKHQEPITQTNVITSETEEIKVSPGHYVYVIRIHGHRYIKGRNTGLVHAEHCECKEAK